MAIQSYWRGERAELDGSFIPATGIKRQGCPLLVAADGPRASAIAGSVGDGLLYGGTMDPEVRRRRLASVGAGKQTWIAPTVSLGEDHRAVREDLGAMVVAMANRAMRGDLTERGVPSDVQADVLEMRRAYDYGFHADNSRPRNTGVVSDRLADHLIDSLCVWGDEARWDKRWTGSSRTAGPASCSSSARPTRRRRSSASASGCARSAGCRSLRRRDRLGLVGAGQAQRVLGDVVEDHLAGDRRDLQQAHDPPQVGEAVVV